MPRDGIRVRIIRFDLHETGRSGQLTFWHCRRSRSSQFFDVQQRGGQPRFFLDKT